MEKYLKETIHTYDQIASNYIQRTKNIPPEREFGLFCSSVTAYGIVIDTGCAWGRDSKNLFHQNFQPIGIDLSLQMLFMAKKYAPDCKFILSDLRKMPIPDNSIDGIWSCATLLHLKRAELLVALMEYNRVLLDKGKCYIQIKKGFGEEVTQNEFSEGLPRFFTYYQEEELEFSVKKAGFSIIDFHVYNEKDRYGMNSRDQEHLCILLEKKI